VATVIVATQEPEAFEVIAERCVDVGATLLREGVDFAVLARSTAIGGQVVSLGGLGGTYDDLFLPLHGAHQAQNAALALAAVEAFLGGTDEKRLEIDNVRDGFSGATSPGRLERVRSSPTILLDAAHNPHGMAATVRALEDEFDFRRLVGVFAVLADKDAEGELTLLEPILSDSVISRTRSPRAMPARRLAELATEVFGPDRVHVEPQLPDAIERAVELAEQDMDGDLGGIGVLITGSVVTVADARLLLRR
jgi:dihydrofolate synthase/folylpolyglutamate synthase